MFDKRAKVRVSIENASYPIPAQFVRKGISIHELLDEIKYQDKEDIIAAIVNNIYCDLSERVFRNSAVKLISLKSDFGLQVYRNTAILILSYAIKKIIGKNILNIGPSIQFNYYFDLQDKEINKKLLKKIRKEFDGIIKKNYLIKNFSLPQNKAERYLERNGEISKARLVRNMNRRPVKFYKVNDYCDICDGPAAGSTGIINKYKFVLYPPGFLIEFPCMAKNKLKIMRLIRPRKISKVFLETRDWYKAQGVSDVAQLNSFIQKNKIFDIIQVSEAMHEKRISYIADEITGRRKKDIKVVLIAGPSSSGKTTFSKRLSVQLKVNGIRPVVISLDNYFLDQKDTPKDKNGNYNFDCLEALDLELFNKHLLDILNNRAIEIPVFDFHNKRRDSNTIPFRPEQDQVVLIEGIHGLNDKLTYAVHKDRKFKIYISAVSQLRLAYNYRINTRDTRLFRRIVRDYNYRNNSAYDTLKMWPNVRKGEEQNIFPFQEKADVIFNSALVYETSVLKPLVYKFLRSVPHSVPEYAEAQRLMDILDYFLPAPVVNVPKVSILREFIGGSTFKY